MKTKKSSKQFKILKYKSYEYNNDSNMTLREIPIYIYIYIYIIKFPSSMLKY